MDSDFVVGINKAIDAAKGESHEYPAYLHNTLVTEKLDELTEAISEGGVAHASIDELDDVTISNPQGGECIKYNATTKQWVNGDDAGNVQSDWNESDPTSGAYILNKPDLVKSRVITGEYETTGLPYAVDDYCIYDHKLYKCTTATTGGTFDSDCWAEVTPCVDLGWSGGSLAASTYGIIDANLQYGINNSEAYYNSGSSSQQVLPSAWQPTPPTGVTRLDAADFSINRYFVGDVVIHDGVLLECATATGGEFDPSCWTESALNGELLDIIVESREKMDKTNPVGTGTLSINRKANSTVGGRSVAVGYNTTASGIDSHAEGYSTNATGTSSHAEGHQTTASGGYSHSEGFQTTASGDNSHAEGHSTKATANSSHTEGYNTTASGSYSHAEGHGTTASGYYSHAEGYNMTAQRKSQHVFGEYNVLDTTGADATKKGSYIEIVGNGTSNNARSNARTLDWSGNEVLAGTIEASGFGPTLAGLIPSITVDSGTLIAGNTTVTISNAAITANSLIIPFVDEAFTGVAPTRQATAAGSVTLTFPVQSTDMPVKVVVI